MAPVRLVLLGSFHLLAGAAPVPGFDQARLQELLAYLLLHRDAPVSRQHLAFLFWPDSTEEQARTNLRNLWHRLRRALPDADRCLLSDELTVRWRGPASEGAAGGEDWFIDVVAFEAHLAAARAADGVAAGSAPGSAPGSAGEIAHLEAAVGLYGGDLLPGCYSDWLLSERERLNQAYSAALERLADRCEARGDYRAAVTHLQALLRHDPLHEPVYARLMRVHALAGDRARALHAYHTCAGVLRRELDVEPGPEMRRLVEQLLAGGPEPGPDPVPAPRSTLPAPASPGLGLVGRKAEWEQLLAAWRTAAPRPRFVLISGEAGIGKTHLAETFARWIARQGFAVRAARCYAAAGALAYAPVAAWLRAAPQPAVADSWLRELGRLLPEWVADRPDLAQPQPISEPWQRLRLFEALARGLLATGSGGGSHVHAANSPSGTPGAARPLLLQLDDVQWCDRDTLDWLQYLLAGRSGQDAGGPLLIVATLRNEGAPPDAVATLCAALRHTEQLTEVRLHPLSPDETLLLADQVLGHPFDRRLAAALYRGSEGNPLFIVEMVAAGDAADSAPAGTALHPDAAFPLPDKVRQVLAARLAQLSPPTRAVLELAAVVGRAFSYEILARAGDLPEDGLVACLDECWQRGLIRELAAGGYDFSHDRLREVAYTGLSRTRRRRLHVRVAQTLERLHAADLERAAAVIAGHYEAADEPVEAAGYHARAAGHARRLYAYADALAHLERSRTLLAAQPPAADVQARLAAVEEQAGDILELQADNDLARTAYLSALDLVAATDPLTRARLHRKIGITRMPGDDTGVQAAAEYEAAEALLAVAPGQTRGPDAWAEWCALQLDILQLLYWQARGAEMAERHACVQPLIEAHGAPIQVAALYGSLSRQINRQGRFAPSDAALGYAHAALAAVGPGAAPEVAASYRFSYGFNLIWHGDYAESEAVLRAALALAEHTGDIMLQVRCLAYLTIALWRQGRVEDVFDAASRCSALVPAHANDYTAAARANLAWVKWRQGDLDAAEQLAREARDSLIRFSPHYPLVWQACWPLIAVALAQGRTGDAVAEARRLCLPLQQALPAALAQPIEAALAAWDANAADDAVRLYLERGLAAAVAQNLA